MTFNFPTIDLNVLVTTILQYMYVVVRFLTALTFTWGGYTFNAFDFTIAAFCLAKIIVIIFGEFIDTDDTDDMYGESPID